MNLLDRAKTLFQNRSALAVVPLAMALASSSAGAAPILPTSTPTCQFPGSCLVSGANAPGGGVTFLGGSAMGSSGGNTPLIVSQSGVMKENAAGSVPVTYSFRLELFDVVLRPLGFAQYSIDLRISQSGGQTFTQTITGDPENFTGFIVIPNVNLVAALPTTTALILPKPVNAGGVRLSFPNSGFITFGVPFSPEETTAPEPASAALLLLATAIV